MTQIVHIVYQDRDDKMIPASRDGMLLVFDSEREAKRHRGTLGVVAPVEIERLAEICKQYNLKLPT